MIVKLLSILALLGTAHAYAQTKPESSKQSEKEGVNEVTFVGPNAVSVVQKGSGNSVHIDHSGRNGAGALQKRTKEFREGNNVVIIQTTDSTLLSGNSSSIVQSGSGNKVVIKQSGRGSRISVSQSPAKKDER